MGRLLSSTPPPYFLLTMFRIITDLFSHNGFKLYNSLLHACHFSFQIQNPYSLSYTLLASLSLSSTLSDTVSIEKITQKEMCTPCTLTRLVRWRVKDWALNFLTCGFPLEEEPETFSSPSHQVSTVNMVFDSIGETKNNASRRQKSRRTIRCSTQAPDTNGSWKKSSTDDQSNWPHFADEDYIVFCFGEDGAFDVVKDAKSEASNDHIDCTITKSPRPVNRKLNYGDEHAETYPKQRHEFVLHEDGDDINPRNQRDFITYNKEVEEIIDSRSPSCRVHRGDQIEENEERGTFSVESNGSNQSDNSTGSFAFPILGWEWTGSPVQMPKSEGQHLRKHKARFVPFHCFRFFDKN